MNWHLDIASIESYRDDTLSPALSASLEAHVVACAQCRSALTAHIDAARATKNWASIADRIDTPYSPLLETVLRRLGVRQHTARLIALTPAFRLAWLGALALVSGLALLAAADYSSGGGGRGIFTFLVLAPLVPVAGVSAAFGRFTDPAHELTVAAPISALEILLVRALAVLATSLPVTALASFALPGDGWTSAAWLLPAIALTTATLALARWIRIHVAAGALGGAWLIAAVVATRGESAVRLIHDYPAFRPAGQAAFLALFALAAASIGATRSSFDLGRSA
ncbi:MAG TPA: hypothetical protein VMZ22_06425 [Acidimicrobiales bacterium]|nr:hypothetical protein [Acidimicrobiales bacterium]